MSLEEIEKELRLRGMKQEKKKTSKSLVKGHESISSKRVLPGVLRDSLRSKVFFEKEKFDVKPSVPSGLPPQDEGDHLTHARFIKRALIGITSLSVTIIAVGLFFIFNSGFGSSRDVSIVLVAPEDIPRGVPFDVSLEIKNGAQTLIQAADLKITKSNGLISLDGNGDATFTNESIGTLGGGSLTKKTFRFLPISEDGKEEKINASLNYSVSGSARFEATKIASVKIKGAALKTEVKYPEKILGGSKFAIEITYENTSSLDFPSLILQATYPSSFRYFSASLDPDVLNNEWHLGELKAHSKGTLQIRGTLEGAKDTKFSFPVSFFTEFSQKRYQIAGESADLNIADSPIALDVLLGGSDNRIARLGDVLQYSIHYQNLSGIALQDVVIKTNLSGEMFDLGALETNGNLDVTKRTIIWDASVLPALRTLDPGASGDLTFTLRAKNQYPITRLNDKNFTLRVDAELTSPSVPFYLSASKTRVVASLETKVAGLLTFDARAFYRDAAGGVANSGPFPPKVNQKTQYTIHWVLRNFSTDVSGVTVRAILPAGVDWAGFVKTNTGTSTIFNFDTREVSWAIDQLPATKGVISDPAEAIFQIEATPTPSYVGNYFPLLEESTLAATDVFTGLAVNLRDNALTTDLVDDATVSRENGRVVP